jgi:hypothetical protein
MSKKIRAISICCSSLLFVTFLSIPYAVNRNGTNYYFWNHMVPREDDNFINPFLPFIFLIPTLIIFTSYRWTLPFKISQHLFFLCYFIGGFFSLYVVAILGLNLLTYTRILPFLDIAVLTGFIFLFWPLALAIPFSSKWKWINWPFDENKKDK